MVNQSSISAYNQAVKSGKATSQRRRIYDLLLREGPMTNRMIGKVLRMELNSVTPRVKSMLDSDILVKSHDGDCPHSGHRVRWVRVGGPQQMEMRI